MSSKKVTLDDISQEILAYLKERDWDNSSRSLATSIVLEASELLEHYQWSEKPVGNKAALSDELADIFIYSIEFALSNDIDIAQAIRAKLTKVKKKYPAQKFKNKSETVREKAWVDTKLKHEKKEL